MFLYNVCNLITQFNMTSGATKQKLNQSLSLQYVDDAFT